jgi:hypothetical protein
MRGACDVIVKRDDPVVYTSAHCRSRLRYTPVICMADERAGRYLRSSASSAR